MQKNILKTLVRQGKFLKNSQRLFNQKVYKNLYALNSVNKLYNQPKFYFTQQVPQVPEHTKLDNSYDLDVTLLRNTQPNYFVQQFYTGCLAEATYYIESEGEVAIVDPLRDVDPYIKLAEENGAQIKYILMTHFHADFVSGHIELAQRTGAKIVYGPTAQPNFDSYIAKDDEVLALGKVGIKVLHTPGHTQESSTFLLENNGSQDAIFTGDTLFLGEVGRPDLAVKSGSITKEDLAGWLYDSIQNKIMNLPDNCIVYPGHGPGSPCGKSIQPGTYDSLGNQKMSNYALKIKNKNDFIKEVSSDLPIPPGYFGHDVALNKNMSRPTTEIVKENNNPLSLQDFENAINNEGYHIIDTRNHVEFLKQGFIKDSFNIDLGQAFALWVGKLITPDKKFVIICDEGKEVEALTRLCRIGYDNVKGFLKGGINTWKNAGKPLADVYLMPATEFEEVTKNDPEYQLVDVRNPGEQSTGYVENSINISLWELEQRLSENSQLLNKDKTIYISCQRGARGVSAVSLLANMGYTKLVNIDGGINAIKETTKIPIAYK